LVRVGMTGWQLSWSNDWEICLNFRRFFSNLVCVWTFSNLRKPLKSLQKSQKCPRSLQTSQKVSEIYNESSNFTKSCRAYKNVFKLRKLSLKFLKCLQTLQKVSEISKNVFKLHKLSQKCPRSLQTLQKVSEMYNESSNFTISLRIF
jgi:uncharacterized membrane protein YgaE (UPF0421/DUF939 family)